MFSVARIASACAEEADDPSLAADELSDDEFIDSSDTCMVGWDDCALEVALEFVLPAQAQSDPASTNAAMLANILAALTLRAPPCCCICFCAAVLL